MTMALPTTITRNVACNNCQRWAIRSFIASIGGSPLLQRPSPRRPFSAPARKWNEAREIPHKADRNDLALNDINESHSTSPGHVSEMEAATQLDPEPDESAKRESYVPWYLQVDPPIAPRENGLSARQRIPDLPSHSPPILEPLIKRVSVELGMDDLSLLDLRELQPPPALGANLLMLIGTARSEKHLHVSADKLCRWLRTDCGMRPFADGLLGRQELKVKMRRRAKKSKLLSAVGAKATADTELDEGIRKNWVCVNVGRVKGGELPRTEAEQEAEKKIIGFGRRTTGSHVVVQMMTEEKRGQIDLEKLWTGQLNRSKKAKEELLKKEDEEGLKEQDEEGEEKQEAYQADAVAAGAHDGSRTPLKPDPALDSELLPGQQIRA